jgi:dienelactone hydrolase
MPVRRVILHLQGLPVAALASGEAAGPGPGVLLVHDAWGLDEEAEALAGALATAGFRVLAPDLLAGRIAGDADEAFALAEGLDPARSVGLVAAAVDALTADSNVRTPARDPAARRRAIGAVGIGMGAPLAAVAATLRLEIAVAILDGPLPELAIEAWERAEARLVVVAAPDDPEVSEPEALLDAPRAAGLEVEVVPRSAGDPGAVGRHLGALLWERLPADRA